MASPALLALAGLAGVRVSPEGLCASAQPICEARHLVFVGGFHHGGTTILQQSLRVAFGLPPLTKQDERFPDDHLAEACSDERWHVFKHPTNTVSD